MNQAYNARHFTAKDAFRFSASIAFLVAAAFFFSNTGHAQVGQPPQQANDSSGYRLIGTMEGKDLAGAVLSDSTGTQTFYRLNELLPDGSKVVKVRSDSISLKRSDGTSYDLYFRGSNSNGHQNGPPATAAVPPAVVQESRPEGRQKEPAVVNRGESSGGQPSKSRHRRRTQSAEE